MPDYKKPLGSMVTQSVADRSREAGEWHISGGMAQQFVWQFTQAELQVFLVVRFVVCCLKSFCWLVGFGVSVNNVFYAIDNCG